MGSTFLWGVLINGYTGPYVADSITYLLIFSGIAELQYQILSYNWVSF